MYLEKNRVDVYIITNLRFQFFVHVILALVNVHIVVVQDKIEFLKLTGGVGVVILGELCPFTQLIHVFGAYSVIHYVYIAISSHVGTQGV